MGWTSHEHSEASVGKAAAGMRSQRTAERSDWRA
jgi:hypothetical protein